MGGGKGEARRMFGPCLPPSLAQHTPERSVSGRRLGRSRTSVDAPIHEPGTYVCMRRFRDCLKLNALRQKKGGIVHMHMNIHPMCHKRANTTQHSTTQHNANAHFRIKTHRRRRRRLSRLRFLARRRRCGISLRPCLGFLLGGVHRLGGGLGGVHDGPAGGVHRQGLLADLVALDHL